MKQHYFLLLFTFLLSCSIQAQDLIITGVYDGPLSGGTPKAIELYVLNDISDLSIYGVGSANNGGGTDGVEAQLPEILYTSRLSNLTLIRSLVLIQIM